MSDTTSTPAPRSADQIQADIDATRERLAGTLDTLQSRVKPENLLRSGVAKVKGVYVKPGGGVRVDRVAATAAAVVGVVLVSRGLRSIGRRVAESRQPDVVYVPVPRSQLGTLV